MRCNTRACGLVFAVVAGLAMASSRGPAQGKRPQVTGEWVGTWGIYAPPKYGAAPAQSGSTAIVSPGSVRAA